MKRIQLVVEQHPDGYVAYRYPDEQGTLEPSRDEFDEALQHAQTIYDFVLSLLPPGAQPG